MFFNIRLHTTPLFLIKRPVYFKILERLTELSVTLVNIFLHPFRTVLEKNILLEILAQRSVKTEFRCCRSHFPQKYIHLELCWQCIVPDL